MGVYTTMCFADFCNFCLWWITLTFQCCGVSLLTTCRYGSLKFKVSDWPFSDTLLFLWQVAEFHQAWLDPKAQSTAVSRRRIGEYLMGQSEWPASWEAVGFLPSYRCGKEIQHREPYLAWLYCMVAVTLSRMIGLFFCYGEKMFDPPVPPCFVLASYLVCYLGK